MLIHRTNVADGIQQQQKRDYTMNTISYKELKQWYLNDERAKKNAEIYFTGKNGRGFTYSIYDYKTGKPFASVTFTKNSVPQYSWHAWAEKQERK